MYSVVFATGLPRSSRSSRTQRLLKLTGRLVSVLLEILGDGDDSETLRFKVEVSIKLLR
jgi:hypothetical protein